MAKSNIRKTGKMIVDGAKNGQLVVSTLAAAATAVATIMQIIDDRKQNQVTIPNLCDREYPLTLTQATELLSDMGINTRSYPLNRRYADAKYKDCCDFQVVSSDPMPGKKTMPGKTVVVRYLTKEAIEESQRLFEEAEKKKAEAKLICSLYRRQ